MTQRVVIAAGLALAAGLVLGAPGEGVAQTRAPAPAATHAPAAPAQATPAARTADTDARRLSPEELAATRRRFRDNFLRLYDTNRDGQVTRPEYDAVRAELFRQTDANKDGSLSEVEYVAEFAGRRRVEQGDRPIDDAYLRAITQASTRFESIDRDRNLSISRAEYDAVAERTFTRGDVNRDGVVTGADWDALPGAHP